ncbi:MAG: DUF3516 domain-containing protein, partial [Myxococcales bacterium]|nr:DUF3516 domain-containing protein [Myxococcales bacterium]
IVGIISEADLVRRTDSSLLDEWERLAHPDEEGPRPAEGEAPPPPLSGVESSIAISTESEHAVSASVVADVNTRKLAAAASVVRGIATSFIGHLPACPPSVRCSGERRRRRRSRRRSGRCPTHRGGWAFFREGAARSTA